MQETFERQTLGGIPGVSALCELSVAPILSQLKLVQIEQAETQCFQLQSAVLVLSICTLHSTTCISIFPQNIPQSASTHLHSTFKNLYQLICTQYATTYLNSLALNIHQPASTHLHSTFHNLPQLNIQHQLILRPYH